MKGEVSKEMWVHQTNCSLAFWMLLPASGQVKSTETSKTRSSHTCCKVALRLTVGFANIYCVHCDRFVIFA